MKIIGLTGSIGMGKSTVAEMFRDLGVPVFDADAEVHRLYRGELVAAIESAFPGVTDASGVDRTKLAPALSDPAAMARLESIVHPAVHESRRRFVEEARADGHKLVVFDIPLLFETGGEKNVAAVVLVSAPYEKQRERVLARPNMSPEKFEAILSRQVPDAEKRKRADIVIDTGVSLEETRKAVEEALQTIAAG
ncbi:MAG: dephospho-CoA kinase [Rhodobiaceae bacterium]|nr:dephospho-CoA kinase [Rhodobiaceae bacterium]MCC0055439.1 dephospho-CoA kinase [Rhodobiaceae bacterium]